MRLINLTTRPRWAVNAKLVGRPFTQAMEKEVRAELGKLERTNVNAAAHYFWRRCREAVNVPYPPASKPYNPPHKRTGTGRNAIKYTFGKSGTPSAWVYIESGPGDYMAAHETGSVPGVLPRPWMEYTFRKYQERIGQILRYGHVIGRMPRSRQR